MESNEDSNAGDSSSNESSSQEDDDNHRSILDDTGLCEYLCKDCRDIFIGVRIQGSLRCPRCYSSNTHIHVRFEDNLK